MCPLSSPSSPKAVFGRAFLAQLQKGDVEMAILFAKAFLAQENGPPLSISEELLAPILA